MIKYSATLKWSDEDNGFIATVPELQGLSAFGETQEEALKELQLAAEVFLESLKSSGEVLPPPNKLVQYSGQIRLRMPKRLHAELASEAENEGISLNLHMVTILAERHAERQTAKALTAIIMNNTQTAAALGFVTNTMKAPYAPIETPVPTVSETVRIDRTWRYQ